MQHLVSSTLLLFLFSVSANQTSANLKPNREQPGFLNRIRLRSDATIIFNGGSTHSTDTVQTVKNDRSSARYRRQVWDYRKCQQLAVLMQKKSMAIRKIETKIQELGPDDEKDPHGRPMRHLQADALRILVQELDETESMIWQSFRWLDEVLSGGDYSSVLSLTGNAWKRLDALRHATLKEEEEYVALVKAEENLQKANHTHVKGVIDNFLHEVSDLADSLEANVDEHIFKDTVHKNESVHVDGFEIETVVRVPYHRSGGFVKTGSRKIRSLPVRLIDSNEDQFVLAKGKDVTMPQDDRHLIQDLILLWMVAAACGWLCSIVELPAILGYVFAGMILGPAVSGSIQCVVQVETFGEFGIFFILFMGGLEFSTSSAKRVFEVSVTCMVFTTCVLSILGVILGLPWNVSITECIFVASCVSLSSSSLVLRFLDSAPGNDIPEVQMDCRDILLGILFIQKIFMGALMALLPNMAEANTTLTELFNALLYVVLVLLTFLFLLFLWSNHRHHSEIWSHLLKHRHRELVVVTLSSILYIFLLVTEHLHVSMELGCFFAGILVSIHSQSFAEEVSEVIRPIKDLFGCLFFAAIGLHIYPQFLAQELFAVVSLTIAAVFAKYILYFVSLTFLVPASTSSCIRWLVPSALSQVSECSFVLGSRARKLGLISREVYLLILGVTSLSFVFVPILWNFSLSSLRKRFWPNGAHTL